MKQQLKTLELAPGTRRRCFLISFGNYVKNSINDNFYSSATDALMYQKLWILNKILDK